MDRVYLKLYEDDARGEAMKFNEFEGPEITADEVERGRKRMRDKKTAGIDGITTEVLKALDGTSLKILMKLCNKIYSTGHIPDDIRIRFWSLYPRSREQLYALISEQLV